MTVGCWLEDARTRLERMGDADASADAAWLICEATGLERSALRWKKDDPLSPVALSRLDSWLSRRLTAEPLQYILGHTAFMGHDFLCDRRALIPRFDTETLVDRALNDMRGRLALTVLDLCCGTGCIGLSVALSRPDARVTLTDISPDSLDLTRENARRLGAVNVSLRQGDLFSPVAGERFDYILCNPPYLDADDMRGLQREVRFEPPLALFGGKDGLSFYRRVAAGARAHLRTGGWIFLEVGQGQAEAVIALLGGEYAQRRVFCDLNGIQRVICARYTPQNVSH